VRWPPAGHSRGRRGGWWRDLGDLHHIAELVGLAELALADRAGIGVGQGHQPVGDRFAPRPLLDLGGDALAMVGQLRKPPRGTKLGLGAATPSRSASLGGQHAGLTDRPGQDPSRLGVQLYHLIAPLTGAPNQRP